MLFWSRRTSRCLEVSFVFLTHIFESSFKAKTEGECKRILIKIGQMQMNIDAMLFDLDGLDVVLGMAWLMK